MGLYEIMFIIRPDLETEEHEEVLNELKSTISKNQGTVEKLIDWQKRRLAYEINKYQEGHYYLVYFSSSGEVIPEIEHFFRVSDTVIRYIVVRTDAQTLEYAAAAEEVPAADEAEDLSESTEVPAPVEGIEEAVAEEAVAEEAVAEEAGTEEAGTEEAGAEEAGAEEIGAGEEGVSEEPAEPGGTGPDEQDSDDADEQEEKSE